MDELKRYFQQHREQLDQDEPGAGLWEKIASGLPDKPVQQTGGILSLMIRRNAAACILVLAGIGTWYILTDHTQTQKTETAAALPKTIHTTPLVQEKIKAGSSEEQPLTQPETGKHEKTAAVRKHKPDIDSYAQRELANLENSFTQVINLQRQKISSIPMYAESPDYFKDFTQQIRQMEKDERGIKSDIARRGMTDELLSQLINVYQQKLNVLKQLQTEMNKTNTRWKQNRVPVDSAHTYFMKL